MLAMVAFAAGVTLADTSWLAGDWYMTAGSQCIEEHWTAPASNALVGMSRTVKDGKMVEFEFLRIEARRDGIYYVAQPGGRPPVDFKLSSGTDSELVFVNPGHPDHLDRIVYRRHGADRLDARVEGRNGDKTFAVDYPYARASSTGAGRCAT